VLFLNDGSIEIQILAEELRADPRFRPIENDVEEAIGRTRGEYVAFLHGLAGLDHRLLSRAAKRLDDRPRSSTVRVAYSVPTTASSDVFRRPDDLVVLDREWGSPIFLMVRRRDLIRGGGFPSLPGLADGEGVEHLTEPLVVMPSHRPTAMAPGVVPPLTSDRSLFATDLRQGPRQAAQAIPRFVVSRLRKRPYRDPAPTRIKHISPPPGQRVRARYIGWSGHDNLGDEALLEAVRRLMGWAEITTAGLAGNLLILGGGTLINRGYLRQLTEHDSPRVERVVFGTGVANPAYWGAPKEDPSGWIQFLQTCGFVGVRGPISAELLRGWGYRSRLEVIGDPALTLEPPLTDRVAGRVVISPGFARGELWGGSDDAVFATLGEVVGRLLAEGRQVHLLSCFPGDDRHIFEIMRRAGHPDLPYLAGYDGIDQAMGLLASADLVIAERLHAAVLSAAAGTPFVSLEYRPKVADFARSVGMERFLVRTDSANPETLLGLVKALDGDSEASERLASLVAGYRAKLTAAAAEIETMVRSPAVGD
ncbi:MAG: polysaccharide pyruvyl transferase family protein, partial [Acidimicrobiia bacterium]|nr:polysaccharide pyruvyl transferase family protein [Acidimicrobiia bacterium]